MQTSNSPVTMSAASFGKLRVQINSLQDGKPIEGAMIQISSTGLPDKVLDETTSNNLGQITPIELPAPPFEYSQEPFANQPYSEYNFKISAPGFEPIEINSAEILPDETAIQNVQLTPTIKPETAELYVIDPHTLYAQYPPKIAEPEVKLVPEGGEIVLSQVVIPEYVVVHNGPPSDTSAKNYYERYRDYIKNVASSEIYATWPESSLQANILAIMSFTLNRVFTEWYRNKGFNFTITSSTAYDHKWIPNRNIFESIDTVVDELFTNYLSRPSIIQPILTQYCDGKNVTCPNWMSQWGSKSLGDQGYPAIDILRNFYGNSIFINTTDEVSGVPSSWPKANLSVGSTGDKVRQMQSQLNTISNSYPLIPKITADGAYGPKTEEAVKVFQSVFGLPQTGVVDFKTWYKISEVYVAVSRIAELV